MKKGLYLRCEAMKKCNENYEKKTERYIRLYRRAINLLVIGVSFLVFIGNAPKPCNTPSYTLKLTVMITFLFV